MKWLRNGNEFLKEKKFSKNEMMKMKRNFYSFTSLEPRDALYGGRTSPACLFKEVKEVIHARQQHVWMIVFIMRMNVV